MRWCARRQGGFAVRSSLHDGQVSPFASHLADLKPGAGNKGRIWIDADHVEATIVELGRQRPAPASGVEHTRRPEAVDEVSHTGLRCHAPTRDGID